MTFDKFTEALNRFRDEVIAEAIETKDAFLPQKELERLYRKFDVAERAMADRIISDWVLSQDTAVRFLAEVLVRSFCITAADVSLRALRERLAGTHTAPAR